MAKKIVPLTDAKVRKAKAGEKLYKLFDGGGLFLAVLPSGVKSWRMKYRDPITGKEKTETLGLYPDVTLGEARAKREEIRGDLSRGKRPGGDGNEKRFGEIVEEFLRHKDISASHKQRQRRRLELYILPKFAQSLPDDIARADLVAVLRRIDDRGVSETARRVFSLTSEVLRFAVANGYAQHNVLADIRPSDILSSPQERHMPAPTDPVEIGRLMATIAEYRGSDITLSALEFLAYTAVRPGNVRMAEWSEIDREGALWTIPAEKMKGKREHIVPLSKQALAILDRVAMYSADNRYVFPSPIYRDRPISDNTMTLALKRIGWRGRIVPHGFRSIFSTIAHERMDDHGCHPIIIESALAHKERNEVKAAYNRAVYLDDRRRMMDWWGEWLESCGDNI